MATENYKSKRKWGYP